MPRLPPRETLTARIPYARQLPPRQHSRYENWYDLEEPEIHENRVAFLYEDTVRSNPVRYCQYWHVFEGTPEEVGPQITRLRNQYLEYSRATGWSLQYDVRRHRFLPKFFVALWWVRDPKPEWQGPLQDIGIACWT